MENQYTCHNLSVRNKRQKSRFKFAGTSSILARYMEVKVVCSLTNPFSLKTIQTRAGRAILTAISLACAAHK